MVLTANKTQLSHGGQLLTCAVRPHSIYGPGDPISWPQMIANAKVRILPIVLFCYSLVFQQGRLKWKLTEDVHESSYTYIDNLIHAKILAATKLVDGDLAFVPPKYLSQTDRCRVSGQAFNVSDGEDGLFWSKLHEVGELSGVPRKDFGRISLAPIFGIIYKIAWFFWVPLHPLASPHLILVLI